MSADPEPVAVTGALGFVASRLLPRLVARGAPVVAVARPGRDATPLERLGVEVRRADLGAPPIPPQAFAGTRAVVHLSGMAQAPWLVPALAAAGVGRGVFVGSAGVYTRLESAGAEAKRAGEAALRASGLAYTILRPSMIYGAARDRNMARLLGWIAAFPVVPVPGGGGTLQQPVHVDDLVAAILAALERPETARREYDVGGPEALPLAEVIRLCGEALGRRVRVLPVPLGPAHAVARLLAGLRLPSPARPEQVLRLAESKAVDIAAARRDLGFAPRSFAEGIRAQAAELPPRR